MIIQNISIDDISVLLQNKKSHKSIKFDIVPFETTQIEYINTSGFRKYNDNIIRLSYKSLFKDPILALLYKLEDYITSDNYYIDYLRFKKYVSYNHFLIEGVIHKKAKKTFLYFVDCPIDICSDSDIWHFNNIFGGFCLPSNYMTSEMGFCLSANDIYATTKWTNSNNIIK